MSCVAKQNTSKPNPIENLLNYDFCPWANRWVYWLKHPLVGLTVGIFAAGLCAVYVSPQAWLLCLGMLLVIVIGLLWPLVSISTLKAEVRFGCVRCEEGQSVRVEVIIQNRLPLPNWGISVTSGDASQSPLASFVYVPGWQRTQFEWEFRPDQRGLYPKTALYLESGFPFGVWKGRRLIASEGEVVVFPRVLRLETVPDLKSQLAFDDQFSPHHSGDAGDVTGTRPYRQGDSLRRIHWGLTARAGHLICTERQATVQSTKRVYLDLSRISHTGTGANSSYEWSIRVFAGVCQAFSQQGMQVQARFGLTEMTIPPGQQSLQRMLTSLARLPVLADQAEQFSASWKNADIAIITNRSQPISSAIELRIEADRFADSSPATGFASTVSISSDKTVNLTSADTLATDLKAGWRRACHAVS